MTARPLPVDKPRVSQVETGNCLDTFKADVSLPSLPTFIRCLELGHVLTRKRLKLQELVLTQNIFARINEFTRNFISEKTKQNSNLQL